ncbi:zinc finger transcription factor [Paraphaeosphaeria minitans]|uniref:Zinc finger transcription factor n=1 Tax=Paraphaeosphaeria minitans TaxID=565426 RepID=A0A9P6KMS1_9PLEO|nr:zinc finger transcription factor [Paraphaeosphaeria minitans]
MPEQDVPGRRLKYRMSCDICHAAKIKCGSQKPSCRRCTVKRLDCVYSISHRKGRPREKRKGMEDGGGTSGLSRPEPTQGPDIWTPPTTNFEAPLTAEPSEASGSQLEADSLAFPTAFASFDLDDDFDFPTMLASLDEPPIPDNSPRPATAGSTSQGESRYVLSPEILESNERDLFYLIDTETSLQHEHSKEGPARSMGMQPERFSQTVFTSFLDNGSSDQALESGLEFLQKGGQLDNVPQLRRGKAPASRISTVRIVLDLMQKTVHNEFMTANRRSNSSAGPAGFSRLVGDQQFSDEPYCCDEYDGSSLYIGNFKVPARARRRYLREMLQARFSKFLMLFEERKRRAHDAGQDCFAVGASALMGTIDRDLKTILGWVELSRSMD